MSTSVLLTSQTISVTPSIEIGAEGLVPPIPDRVDTTIRETVHQNAVATGEGYLFRSLYPMAESSDGKPSRANRLIGRRWSYLRDAYRYAFRSCFRTTPLAGDAYWVTDNMSDNYAHWFLDVFAKVHLLARRQQDIHIVLPERIARFAFSEPSIRLLGIQRITVVPEGQSLKIERLHTVNARCIKGSARSDIALEINRQIRTAIGADLAKAPSRRVYISRAGATKRRVENEAALLPVLERHGFDIIRAETLSFLQQAQLMAETDLLVSTHGAGLTNMYFMPPGGSVLEFRVRKNPPCFVNLASALGHRHYSLAVSLAKERSVHWADVVVDPALLDAALTRITGATATEAAS